MIATLGVGDRLGGYQILSRIGRGGMAEVFRARQVSIDRVVAIKILPPFLADQEGFSERFRREATVVARLKHPNIPTIYDFGESDGLAYIAMELVEGGSLKQRLEARGRFDLAGAVGILRQAAAALDYAHRRQVLHRDVKPSNILIDRDDQVYLADFGVALAVDNEARLTRTNLGVGTPQYMAPEQIRGHAEPRSDVYAFGIVAYELLTGRVPFDGDTPWSVMHKHLSEPLPPPSTFEPSIGPAVDSVLEKALARDPEDRFETAGDLVTELEASALARGRGVPIGGADWDTQSRPTTPRSPAPSETEPGGGPAPVRAAPAVTVRRRTGTLPSGGRARTLALVIPALLLLTAGAVLPFRMGLLPPLTGLGAMTARAEPTAAAFAPPVAPTAAPTVAAFVPPVAPTAVPTVAPTVASAVAPAVASTSTSTAGPTATPIPAAATAAAPIVAASSADRLRTAEAAVDAGDFQHALALLTALRDAEGETPETTELLYRSHVGFGKVLLDRHDLDASYAQYGQALKLRPDDPVALDGQKQVVLTKNWDRMEAAWDTDDGAAIAALEEIMLLAPDFRQTRQKLYALLVARADRLLGAQERASATTVLVRALEVNPDGAEARQRLVSLTPTPEPTPIPVVESPPAPARQQPAQAAPAPARAPQPAPAQPAYRPAPAAPAQNPAPASGERPAFRP